MWYCITGTDHPESLERRMAARPQHLARLGDPTHVVLHHRHGSP